MRLGEAECSGVERHYLLFAVAGRRQDDRASIRPQNKVKCLVSTGGLIPEAQNPAQIPQINSWCRGEGGPKPGGGRLERFFF